MEILMPNKRLRVVFLLFCFLGVSYQGVFANEPLEKTLAQKRYLSEILDEIGEKYQVFFNYESSLISNIKVDFELAEAESLNNAVNRLMRLTNLKYELTSDKFVVIYRNDKQGKKKAKKAKKRIKKLQKLEKQGGVQIQRKSSNPIKHSLNIMDAVTLFQKEEKNISGTVHSVDGSPLIGASVIAKRTSTGTVTDLDGNFEFSVPDEVTVLIVSYIGYESQEIEILSNTVFNIILQESSSTLDEVVVVGYGSQKRSDVTGSIASLKNENFNKGVVANPGQLLQGKVAGVNITAASGEPGASQDIIIRGVGSLRSGTTPLFVVDGFALDNSVNGVPTNPLNFINPQDIASIDVLKDASAAAIYGARAANGVIVITTKKGIGGQSQINFSASTAVTSLSKKIDVFSASEFRSQINAINGILNDGGANTDWQDELTRTASSQRVDFSMSGGAKSSSYFASFSGENQEGILRNNNLKRYSGRLNLTQSALNDRLKVEFNFSASRVENNRANASSVVRDMLQLNPTFPSRQNEVPTDLVGDNINPLVLESIYGDISFNNRILANLAPSIEIIKGLTYKLNLGIDYSTTDRDVQFIPFPRIADFEEGSLSSSFTSNSNTQTENTLTYKIDKDQSTLSVLAGHSYQETKVNGKGFLTSGFPTNGVEPRYQIGAASEPTEQSAFATINELQSFFGRVNYSYNNKYMLTATMRADGSSKFGANNKYGYFPSVALGWNIMNEDFIADSKNIDNLKLRISWGKTGNQEIPSKITQASFTESNTGNDTYPLNANATALSDYPFGSIFTTPC